MSETKLISLKAS